MKIIVFYIFLIFLLASCGEDKGTSLFNSDIKFPSSTNGQTETETETDVPVVVDLNGNGNYASLNDALSAGEKNILINSGTYEISEIITIDQDNVTIEGASKDDVSVIQMNGDKDLFIIKSDNVVIKNLTLDTETYNAQAVIVEAGGNNITIENNNIYGGSNIIPIFFAGPPVSTDGTNSNTRDETINVYLGNGESQHDFSKFNIIKNNIIRSNFNGSSISVSLQRFGEISNNTVEGGMINLSMNKDLLISENTIVNSIRSGISITLPSENISVADNIIQNSSLHGIFMLPQYDEHGHENENIISSGIDITGNTISASIYGIALQGYNSAHESWGSVSGVAISSNVINQYDFSGMWLYELSNVLVNLNTINFNECTISTRGTGDIPAIASRDSAGIHLYDGLYSFIITSNSISKNASCTDISVAQNAITISNQVLNSAAIDTVVISNNSFVNESSDWMHSNVSYLDDYIFISSNPAGDFSAYEGIDFHGVDVQNLSVIDQISTSLNSNTIQ